MNNKLGILLALGVLILLGFSGRAAAQDATPQTANVQDDQPPACKVIRTVQYPVTKTRSKKTKMRIALLDLCPPNRGMVARPMLPLMINGEMKMFEYDVVRVFKNRKEAQKYAKENDIKDIEEQ